MANAERSRASGSPRERRAGVIDIGSNSIRLVVYDAPARALVPLYNEKAMCGLGKGLVGRGRLAPEGASLALSTLRRFTDLARAMEVGRLDVIATAAVREAEDGAEFAKAVERRCGVKVRVLSGEEEGRLSALGVTSDVPGAAGVVGDLGGGSL
ncbi:MAG: Ppx/GppA family phosphatase, partial [Alphaproteobacteria bacterium]|nr:Ppx/GppA family phosphatase [Alphaproteobacteria bacterium]